MRPARLRLKNPSDLFAAGQEVAVALEILPRRPSDCIATCAERRAAQRALGVAPPPGGVRQLPSGRCSLGNHTASLPEGFP